MTSCCKETSAQDMKFERSLNFSTAQNEDDEYNFPKKKVSRDPMSHRIIEKRRRDRMNNCLADLSRLIPSNYLKKGHGRIEKTEIVEMAINHLKYLQTQAESMGKKNPSNTVTVMSENRSAVVMEQFRLGFHDCTTEVMRFLVEVEGYYAGEGLCIRLMNHLQAHCEKITKSQILQNEKTSKVMNFTSDTSQDTLLSSTNSSELSKINNGLKSDSDNMASYQSNCSMDIQLGDYPSLGQQTSDYESDIGISQWQINNSERSGSQSSCTSGQYVPNQLQDISQSLDRSVQKFHQEMGIARPEEVYKFKTNIKERFKADLEFIKKDIDVKAEPLVTNCALTLSNTEAFSTDLENNILIREACDHLPANTINCQNAQNITSTYTQTSNCDIPLFKSGHESPSSQFIPIFALHSSGTYYIPLSINSSYLDSLLSKYSELSNGLSLCHPVHILVSFSGLCKVTEASDWNNINNLNSSSLTSSNFLTNNQQSARTLYGVSPLSISKV